MATDVERLAILIEANTRQYTSAMQKLERDTNRAMGQSTRSVRRLDAQMRSAALSARNFLGLFGITIGIAGISRMLDDLDALGKAAQRTGVDVEELQALIHAASLSGSDSAGLVRSFERLNEEIAKASTRSTELGRILEANGVPIRDANGELRSSKDLWFAIADLIKNAANQQEAALIARLAFGRSSRELIPLLQQGADGLRDQAQAARDAGVVIDKEIIAAAERFNDAWETAWLSFRANAFNGVSGIIGFFDNLDARLREFGREHGLDIFGGGSSDGRKPLEITLTNPNGPPARETVLPVKTEGGGGGASDTDRAREALDRLIVSRQTELAVLRELDPVQREMLRHHETLAVATDAERRNFENLTRVMLDLERAQIQAAEQMQFFQNAAFGALDGLIVRGAKASDVIRDLVAQLARAALHSAIFGGGLFGGPGIGSLFGGGAAAPNFAGHYAGGGSVPAGRWGVMGERGPEPVFGPATVLPNSALRGEANVEVNVINQGGGEVSRRDRQGAGGLRIVDVIVGAVKEDLVRGGFDSSMQARFGARPMVAGRSGG